MTPKVDIKTACKQKLDNKIGEGLFTKQKSLNLIHFQVVYDRNKSSAEISAEISADISVRFRFGQFQKFRPKHLQ